MYVGYKHVCTHVSSFAMQVCICADLFLIYFLFCEIVSLIDLDLSARLAAQ